MTWMEVQLLRSWTREDLLYIPPALAAISLVYVAFKIVRFSLIQDAEADFVEHTSGAKDGDLLERFDGATILIFRVLRLLTVFALLGLEVFELSAGTGSSARVYHTPFFIYVSLLAIASFDTSPRWRDFASLHLALLLFATFVVLFVLDVFPYAMLPPSPFDPPAEPSTWVRVALLTFSGFIIPAVMPRPFRPSTPDAEPNREEVASILSSLTYSYLDAIVWYAYRVPDVTIKDMPPVPERGRIDAVAKRALPALDPVQVGKRHIIWGILSVWYREYLLLMLCNCLQTLAKFTGPYGMRNLLLYLETGTSSYGLRPWFWILMLVVGPLISASFSTQFLYISCRIDVENESVMTYLIFHHSLRIRLKGDVLDSKSEKDKAESKDAKDNSTQTTVTPAATDTEETEAETDTATSTTAVSDSGSESKADGGQAQEKTGHLIGRINNLITSDVSAVGSTYNVVTMPAALLQMVISIAFLYNLVGWSAFVGLAVMVFCAPAPAWLGKQMVSLQAGKMASTDKRVQSVTEAMGVLRLIKLFGWEPYMLTQLERRRDEELVKLRRYRLIEAAMDAINHMLPLLSKITVIGIYTLSSRGEMDASRIFAALMLFSMMEEQIYMLMARIPALLKSKVACDRFTQFLNSTELLTEGNGLLTDNVVATEQPERDVIGFKECTFSWDSFGKGESPAPAKHHGRKQFNLRFDDEVVFKSGHINIIVGPTASGKTSVLLALLGEMYYKPHGLGSWYSLPRDGGVAYAPQESWVLNETIRENILFGEPYNEERYKKVLKQCALEKDLEMWEAGDQTEVGEKGLTLSGGQKARVTFARALYSSASILLLDDVLAALDVHTAKWIVDEALKGDLIKGRTVLLVTHNIALAAPAASHVVVLTRHGGISAQGPVSEVLKQDSQLRAQVEKEREKVSEVIETKPENTSEDKDVDTEVAKKAAGKLVVEEEKAMGRVEMAAVMLYIASIGGPMAWFSIVGPRLIGDFALTFQTWFVGYWSNQYEIHPISEIPVLKYLIIFALANVLVAIIDFVAQFIWVSRTMKASKTIHTRLLQSIFTSSFRWLDVTPVGRIIARCTQDMGTIDQLGNFANSFLSITLYLINLFFASVLMVGWYALISGFLVAVLGILLGRVYLKCQINTRREMSNAKAPVMTSVGTALSGLHSIRAYNAKDIFDNELKRRVNLLARSSYCFYDINRWITIRIDSLGAIFAGVVATYLVYGGQVSAGYSGFTLSVVLAFSRIILYWVRWYNLIEIQANSLERMLEFMRIEHEPEPSESRKPPAYWPSSGELRVEKLSARYSDDSPTILKDISFVVKSGERVGVVGRTGAGKSSIALSLLRAIKTDGKVYYDGLPTDEINLDALRANITLIPQQPELINGTLRENLDPFGQHGDATLNDALSASGFFSIKDMDTKQQPSHGEESSSATQGTTEADQSSDIGLDTMVENGGTNFSLGQRQIIALARAIVRRSKLLILDEATAAIDYDTDAAIQKTLRTEFSKDTTLITIAHRLQTIMDYDKIMVLDAGELVEFDSPKELLLKKGGYFRLLVDESDDRELLRSLVSG